MNAWELKREAALRVGLEKVRECRTSKKKDKVWCAENDIAQSHILQVGENVPGKNRIKPERMET